MKLKSLTKDKINVPDPLPIQHEIATNLDKEMEAFKGMRQRRKNGLRGESPR